MKIKTIFYTLIFFIFFSKNILSAETIFFDSKNIKIEENGNMIFATTGIAKIPSKNLTIKGDKFIYDKIRSELTIFDDVKYNDNKNRIFIESQKLIYNEIDNLVFSQGETFIDMKNKYEIFSSDVLYDRNILKISSKKSTEVNDSLENKFIFDKGLIFNISKEIISSKKAFVTDNNLNNYFFKNSKINLKINEIVGKEIKVDFINSFFGDEDNDPQLKGKAVTSNDKETKIFKTVFSTCNIENKNCRGWELESDIFTHNKIEKLFEYEKSWLRVFNKKLFYLPYFNHPDPTVKRKSGFLTPSYISSNNLGSSLTVPYFYAPNKSKDFTIKPRIFLNNELILQSEYREAFKNSDLIADFSINRDDNTNTHFFANLNGKLNEKVEYDAQIQNVTNDNYLKVYGIKDYTPLITNDSTLSSYLKINKEIDENTDLRTTLTLYEDLSKKDNDRYQYIFPNFSFDKSINLDESYHGNFQFTSSGYQKLFDTNKYEALINNDFNFNSFDYISSKGILSDYSLLLKNYNTYNQNSDSKNNDNDHEIFATVLFQSELPLKKELTNTNNYLKPIIQARFSPTNGKDISSQSTRLQYGNIFSQNRIGTSDMVEKGASLTFGVEFEKQNLENDKLLGFRIGNVIKDKKNDDLPSKSKLDQTRSDIVGDIFYKIENLVELNYTFSYDRDLNFSNYDVIAAKFGENNLVSTFNYITENHELGDSEIIKNDTKLKFNNEHSLLFNTTKNLRDDFTQYYKLTYEYETDCLSASFQYQKKFFRDGNLVPDESLYFLIRFIPFAELRGSANTIFEK